MIANGVSMSSSTKKDSRKRLTSGIGGEVGEMYELLMDMQQTREDLLATTAAKKTAQRDCNEEKGSFGKAFMAIATKLGTIESSTNSEEEETRSAPKKAKMKSFRVVPSMDMATLSSDMYDADLARIELDHVRLQFKRDRSEIYRLQREPEREERRKKQEKNDKFEFSNYKLLKGPKQE